MIFGELPLEEAGGAVLVHSIRLGKLVLKKGRVLSTADLAALRGAGRRSVVAARLEPGDIAEDEAAARLAAALAGPHLLTSAAFTGRANLLAGSAGLVVLDRERLDRLNRVSESITAATLPPFNPVAPQEMVATVKIIPFAVPAGELDTCLAIAREAGPMLRVAPFRARPVALIQTRLPGVKDSMLDKTLEILNGRLASLGVPPATERRCDHATEPLARLIGEAQLGGAEIVLVAGASAITDRRDVIPAAIERAGGRIEHFGMPVDPGNLLLLGRLGTADVMGLPGCVRSPKPNGFDWVLQRRIADIPVGRDDIMGMGVGGLLKEIPLRPQPRAGEGPISPIADPRALRVAALVMAAGRSSRMGAANKLLSEVDGEPMLRRVVGAALASGARPIVVVLGHDAHRVRAALRGCKVRFVENPRYAEGMSTSLRCGLAALPDDTEGAVILLGDMPRVSSEAIDRLVAAFDPIEGRGICVPTWNGKRGNPVLWGRRYFQEIAAVAGDVGARHLIGEHGDQVAEVPMPDDSVLIDIDTPEELGALRRDRGREA
jgi:molybdenum cofactor cytidylyltransferase